MNAPERYRRNTSSFSYYWTKGTGAELLESLGFTPDLANADKYVPLLYQFDGAGDKVVHQLHQEIGFVKAQQLVDAYFNDTSQAEEVLKDFFSGIDLRPPWLDRNLIQKGIELSQRSGIPGLVVLRDYCLMGGYESAAINKPLIYTGALKKGAAKRIAETVEFWVNITADDSLLPDRLGLRSIFKTRFIHSYSRINILKATDWDSAKWGIPLNLWDMLATNLGFSLVFLVGLRRLGMKVLPEEVEGLFHLWKYIGYLLGIPLELLPDTEKQAIEALYYWTMTQADGDEDSKLLAHALQEESMTAAYPTSYFARKMLRALHLHYNHYLLGNYSCDLLGLQWTLVGKFGMLNIWRNGWESRRSHDPSYRRKLIHKGRKIHEFVRDTYRKK
jgi:hypothetical protein